MTKDIFFKTNFYDIFMACGFLMDHDLKLHGLFVVLIKPMNFEMQVKTDSWYFHSFFMAKALQCSLIDNTLSQYSPPS